MVNTLKLNYLYLLEHIIGVFGMKITKTQLKQLIKEELASVTENTGPMLNMAVGDEIEG